MANIRILLLLTLFISGLATAQNKKYTIQNAHSHNDYEQKNPFFTAYNLGFGSIEADLYTKDNELYVAHDKKDIKPERTFKALYLNPLLEKIQQNNNYPYPQKRSIQLLIDLKENGVEILQILESQLKPHYSKLKNVQIIISGDMPKPEDFSKYPKIFSFDGRININYTKKTYKRVGLVSASLMSFGKYWSGKDEISVEPYQKISNFVQKTHQKGKKVRLWATPNTEMGFQTLMNLGVDYIGTDDLEKLANFLTNQ